MNQLSKPAPTARDLVEVDGYMVTAKWMYGSGYRHAACTSELTRREMRGVA